MYLDQSLRIHFLTVSKLRYKNISFYFAEKNSSVTSKIENTSQLQTRPVDRFADTDTFTVPPVKIDGRMMSKYQYNTYYDCELLSVYYLITYF